jgi:protein TonB
MVLKSKELLLIALAVAVVFHLILVVAWSLGSHKSEAERLSQPIEITLISKPTEKEEDKADFLAQENQSGAGRSLSQAESTAQQTASQSEHKKEKPIKKTALEEQRSKPKAKPEQPVLTSVKAESKVVAAQKTKVAKEPEQHPKLTADLLQQQITQLGTEIRQSQPSAQQTKIKFVDAVSAHKYIAAQYMKDWESKVERMGNLNYPEVALKKNFSGTLTMDVGVNADGSIYSIRIGKSSGNLDLDEAAKKIVRMSAPFAPLPLDLRKEVNVLVITRVWKFSDESGLITQ